MLKRWKTGKKWSVKTNQRWLLKKTIQMSTKVWNSFLLLICLFDRCFSLFDVDQNEIYHCTYRFGSDQIELEYNKLAHQWKILSIQSNFQLNRFESLKEFLSQFQSIENLSFDQQIQLIIKKFDQFFSGSIRFSSSRWIFPYRYSIRLEFHGIEIVWQRIISRRWNHISFETSFDIKSNSSRKFIKCQQHSLHIVRFVALSSSSSFFFLSNSIVFLFIENERFIPSPRLSLSYRRIIYSIVLNVKIKLKKNPMKIFSRKVQPVKFSFVLDENRWRNFLVYFVLNLRPLIYVV